jgi:hypothetical protein
VCDLAYVLLLEQADHETVNGYLDAEAVTVDPEAAELKGVLGLR